MDAIERLTSLFERFPGIGPRQAQRFVQFLLRLSPATRREFVELLGALDKNVRQCAACMRYFSLPAQTGGEEKFCSFCTSPKRDTQYLAIVASDADLAALEKSGTYRGRYFVLGGTISLASEKSDYLRTKGLLTSLSARAKNGLKEIILAFPANPEGDATAAQVREELAATTKKLSLNITSLGRGLSTGSELEYADPETIKNALEGRK